MKKESDESKKSGNSPQKKNPRNRRAGPRFEWGEVDNVSQEDMLLPAKKKKGSRRRIDHVESTLTVGAEEADPYAIKPVDSHAADDPMIPSYGKRVEGDNDEFDIFLRNAERADARDKERERARKEQKENPKPKKSAPPKKTAPAEMPDKHKGESRNFAVPPSFTRSLRNGPPWVFSQALLG